MVCEEIRKFFGCEAKRPDRKTRGEPIFGVGWFDSPRVGLVCAFVYLFGWLVGRFARFVCLGQGVGLCLQRSKGFGKLGFP